MRDPKPLVDPLGAAAAQTLWVGRQGFALDVPPRRFLVRVNFTPYWSIAARQRLHPPPRRLDRRPRELARRVVRVGSRPPGAAGPLLRARTGVCSDAR